MNIKCELSYNGQRSERKLPMALRLKIEPLLYLGMTGEYRCACVESDAEVLRFAPLGLLYYGNKSNPEWIVTLSP